MHRAPQRDEWEEENHANLGVVEQLMMRREGFINSGLYGPNDQLIKELDRQIK
jgi:hypothetical protein